MSEYGSGLTYGQTAMLDKERIKHAFRNELVAGEDEKPVHGEAREMVIDDDLRKEEETREREQQE